MQEVQIDRDQAHLLLPLCIASGVLIAIVPILHPYGTCADWLQKWGDLYAHMRMWVWLHKLGMFGFALSAGIGFFFPVLSRRTYASVAGGVCLGIGSSFMALSTMIHATATSAIGKSYNASSIPSDRALLRSIGEAFEAYDVGITGGASMLISGGAVLITLALWRRGVLSTIPAIIMAGLGLVWTAQFHAVFNRLGFSVPETIHWASYGLFLIALGLFLHAHHRGAAAGASARAEQPPTEFAKAN